MTLGHGSQMPHSFNSARGWPCFSHTLSGFHSVRFPKTSEWVFDFEKNIGINFWSSKSQTGSKTCFFKFIKPRHPWTRTYNLISRALFRNVGMDFCFKNFPKMSCFLLYNWQISHINSKYNLFKFYINLTKLKIQNGWLLTSVGKKTWWHEFEICHLQTILVFL